MEVLIRWAGLPEHDTSWEPFDVVNVQFPHFHLEDKVRLWGGGNDKPPVRYTYVRRKHKGLLEGRMENGAESASEEKKKEADGSNCGGSLRGTRGFLRNIASACSSQSLSIHRLLQLVSLNCLPLAFCNEIHERFLGAKHKTNKEASPSAPLDQGAEILFLDNANEIGFVVFDDDGIGESVELDPSQFSSLLESKPNNYKFSSVHNWLQCRAVLDGSLDGANETICGKWRRAPLFEVQTDDWECYCSVLWDSRYADCAVPQEMETDKVLEQLKDFEKLRPRLWERRKISDHTKSNDLNVWRMEDLQPQALETGKRTMDFEGMVRIFKEVIEEDFSFA
ncbi:hypothetical protein L484_016870 [Morus notabilis]|uniref:CW-type domain-containing protein n=1 Tax=Morus notabilis TaxID=981085 RepID=W9QPE2_9ROSA|nr:hypothetical protein L484_016870 [Morus notabilis]